MLHEHRFRGMNTEIGIWIWSTGGDRLTIRPRLDWARHFFESVEAEMSRFRETSALSRINRAAGCGPQIVPERLWSVLTAAFEAAGDSDGIFDPTLGRTMARIGYDRSFECIAARDGADSVSSAAPVLASWRRMRLDSAVQSVTLPSDAALDLGGIAKGWTVDYVARALAALGPVLVDAGGDIRAIGTIAGEPWLVGVQDPFDPECDRGRVRLQGALATSSIGGRRWQRGGRMLHHLVDPRTGTSAESDLYAVTVHAPDATAAEVAAKVALVLGSQSGSAYILKRGLSAFFVSAAGRESVIGRFPFEGVDLHVSSGA